MPLHDRPHALEVASEQRSQRLRIGRLAQRRRADHVAKEHRHRLALLTRSRRLDERSAAERAESKLLGALAPTARALEHKEEAKPFGSDSHAGSRASAGAAAFPDARSAAPNRPGEEQDGRAPP